MKKIDAKNLKKEAVGKIIILQHKDKIVIRVDDVEETDDGSEIVGTEIGGERDGQQGRFLYNPDGKDINVYEEREEARALLQ